ncbi:MAG: hypothetical protein JO202_17815 [Ktedonobacteraceae bacterium]|nr:hypothetical protein [Ktedonobacteraceae bacterium]
MLQLEPTLRAGQVLHINAKLIESNNILHLSADELERIVSQEQTQNTALEVIECRVCLFCGTQMYGQECPLCGRFTRTTRALPLLHEQTTPFFAEQQSLYSQQNNFDSDNYGFILADSDDAYSSYIHWRDIGRSTSARTGGTSITC